MPPVLSAEADQALTSQECQRWTFGILFDGTMLARCDRDLPVRLAAREPIL
jgi:hypothetical protein